MAAFALAVGRHDTLRDRLAWFGGSALHLGHLPVPQRPSVDLDYLLIGPPWSFRWMNDLRDVGRELGLPRPQAVHRVSDHAGPLRQAFHAARNLGDDYGFDITRLAGRRSYAGLSFPFARLDDGQVRDFKVDVVIEWVDRVDRELVRIPVSVELPAPWGGSGSVLALSPAAALANKLQILEDNSRGRDLADFTLARTHFCVDDRTLATALAAEFARRPTTVAQLRAALVSHRNDPVFCHEAITNGITNPHDTIDELLTFVDRHLDPALATPRPSSVA